MHTAKDGLWGHSASGGDPLGYIIASSTKSAIHVIMDPDLGPPSKVVIGCWHGELEIAYLYGFSRLLVKPAALRRLFGDQEALLWLHPQLDARDRRHAYLVSPQLADEASRVNVMVQSFVETRAKPLGVFMSTTKDAIGAARGAGILDCYTFDPMDGSYYVATEWPANFVSVGGALEAKAPGMMRP